ncbi:MAG: acireductone synthase [Pseudomonadales bacterium]|nr:acireductone synthase [Pseudomonadales bacterium]
MTLKAVVTDIEGTTSSIRFVHEVLFPYARNMLGPFLKAREGEREVRDIRAAVAEEASVDAADLDAVVAALERFIDEDRKWTPLKTLQGLMWAQGYAEGALKGHIYEDAVTALKRWHDAGLALYVYSSGSVAAQQLLFGHSLAGDLTPLFSGYFDTRVGPKRTLGSYQAIAATLELPGDAIMFLSDVVEELDAARAAGLKTALLVRPEDSALDLARAAETTHLAVARMTDLPLERLA